MQYTEYKNAAKRHIDTCKVLRDAYNAKISSGNLKLEETSNLLKNIYYLCGYVVECSVYYAFFQKAYKGKNETNTRELGKSIKYENFKWENIERHFILDANSGTDKRKHSIEVLRVIKDKLPKSLKKICGEQIDFKNEEEHNKIQPAINLIERWTTGFRYEIISPFNENDVFLLYNEVKTIFEKLTKG